MSWLPAWLLACALTAAPPAMAQPAPTPEPTGEQVKAFLENRSDPVVGAWVAQKLQPAGATSTAPPALDATVGQETAQGEIAGYLDARLKVIAGHLVDLRTALPTLPAELAAAAGRLTAEFSERGLAEIVLLLVTFVGLGVGAELLFAWATSGVVRRLKTAPVAAPGPRARVALTGLLFGLARTLCFAAGSIGGFLLFTWPPNLRQVVLGYLSAMLVLRLTIIIGRLLFAPGEPRCRIVPMSDRAAAFWQSWGSAFVGWYAFGYATIQLLRGLGMSFPSSQLLAYLLALGLLAIALRLVWRPGSTTAGRVVGTTLTVLIWAAGVAGAKPSMWTLIVAAGTVVLLRVTHRAVMHLFRVETSGEEDAGPQPMPVWAVVVDRGAQALVIVAGIWLLSWGWGLDVIEIAARDTPATRLLIGALHAVVILLVADLLWQLASKAIDRRLRHTGPAADGHGEEHGPALSPDEVRRRGRLRTLLPILRIVLLVVLATMAVLMSLSALGVQVAPLIAGAGVVGVAIGFGSQTLVKGDCPAFDGRRVGVRSWLRESDALARLFVRPIVVICFAAILEPILCFGVQASAEPMDMALSKHVAVLDYAVGYDHLGSGNNILDIFVSDFVSDKLERTDCFAILDNPEALRDAVIRRTIWETRANEASHGNTIDYGKRLSVISDGYPKWRSTERNTPNSFSSIIPPIKGLRIFIDDNEDRPLKLVEALFGHPGGSGSCVGGTLSDGELSLSSSPQPDGCAPQSKGEYSNGNRGSSDDTAFVSLDEPSQTEEESKSKSIKTGAVFVCGLVVILFAYFLAREE